MYFDPCFKYLIIFFILENLSSKIGGYIQQFSLKMKIHRSDFHVTNISGTRTINVIIISTIPLKFFSALQAQKNNFYHSSPWFVSVIATLWYFQCWCFDYQKTPSLIYFLCLNISFHFYACALRFTCIICTFILHIKLWINFICEFFICLHTICKHYSSLTKITR